MPADRMQTVYVEAADLPEVKARLSALADENAQLRKELRNVMDLFALAVDAAGSRLRITAAALTGDVPELRVTDTVFGDRLYSTRHVAIGGEQ